MKGNRLALRNALATSLCMASIKVSSSSASSPLASIVRPLSRQVCSMAAMMQGQIVLRVVFFVAVEGEGRPTKLQGHS